jgi:hypothetical protein
MPEGVALRLRSIRGVSPERLTACLIVQDEQEHLPRALESVAFCDEVVVVDGGSSDRTVQIARGAGARVIESPWPGFAAQRNVALDAASSDWVFELDADECISPCLRASIERFLLDPPTDVNIAVCPLRNRFLGGLIGPSAKYPAYRSRLFRRSAYRHDESRAVHEGIEPRERPALLEGDIEHELAATPLEALVDVWHYARLESQHIAPPRGARAYVVGIALRPTVKSVYRLVVDRGWRDGWRGLVKIWLDSASDALVWLLVLARAARSATPSATHGATPSTIRGATPSSSGATRSASASAGTSSLQGSQAPGGTHFGRRPVGPAKVIALAGRGSSVKAAREWLDVLHQDGIDTALVCDCEPDESRGATTSVHTLRPLAAMRAVDVEMQIRTAHAVIPFGWRAKLVHRMLPGALRPAIAGIDASTDPLFAAHALSQSDAPARSVPAHDPIR